jgi:hypothetical protein
MVLTFTITLYHKEQGLSRPLRAKTHFSLYIVAVFGAPKYGPEFVVVLFGRLRSKPKEVPDGREMVSGWEFLKWWLGIPQITNYNYCRSPLNVARFIRSSSISGPFCVSSTMG